MSQLDSKWLKNSSVTGEKIATEAIDATKIADGAITSPKLDQSGVALPAGSTAATQLAGDNTTKVATTSFVVGEVNVEAVARANADSSLQVEIDGHETRLDTAETDITALEAADLALQSEIDAVEAEVVAARGAETSLNARISSVESLASSGGTGLADHMSDAIDAHDASAISVDDVAFVAIVGSDAQSVLASADAQIGGLDSSVQLIQTDVQAIITSKGANSGIATLDSTGKLNSSQLPSVAVTDTFVIATEVAMLALVAETGDVAVRTDLNKSFILQGTDPTVLASWQELLTPTDAVLSVNGLVGAVQIDADDVPTAPITGVTGSNVQAVLGDLKTQIDSATSAGANKTLSNLISPVAANQNINPDSSANFRQLGTNTLRWGNIISQQFQMYNTGGQLRLDITPNSLAPDGSQGAAIRTAADGVRMAIHTQNASGPTASADLVVGSGSSVNGSSGNLDLVAGPVSGTGVRGKIRMNSNVIEAMGVIAPDTDGSRNLGISNKRFASAYINNVPDANNVTATNFLSRKLLADNGSFSDVDMLSWGTLGQINVHSNKIVGLANGTLATDAVNKGQLDAVSAAASSGGQGLIDHMADTDDAHAASAISFDNSTAALTGTPTNVKGAIEALKGELDAETSSRVSSDGALTTAIGVVESDLDTEILDRAAADTALDGRLTTAEADIVALGGADVALDGRVDSLETFQTDVETQNPWIATTPLLDGSSKIQASFLPSYVDDVIEAADLTAIQALTGEAGKIYVALDTSKVYRFSGSIFVEVSASEVTSVNGMTGAVTLTTTSVTEGSNQYFTAARAREAVETDGVTTKYVGNAIVSLKGKKEAITLSALNITNGYVDLQQLAAAETMMLSPYGGPVQKEGVDYTLSVQGGVTRVTFGGDLAALAAAGDELLISYQYL